MSVIELLTVAATCSTLRETFDAGCETDFWGTSRCAEAIAETRTHAAPKTDNAANFAGKLIRTLPSLALTQHAVIQEKL